MLGYALLLRRGLFLAVVSVFFFFLLFFKVMYLILRFCIWLVFFFDIFLLFISQCLLWCISPSLPNSLHAPASVNY